MGDGGLAAVAEWARPPPLRAGSQFRSSTKSRPSTDTRMVLSRGVPVRRLQGFEPFDPAGP